MSGIFLPVWSDHKDRDTVLKRTKGGDPHITLGYSGNKVTKDNLLKTAICGLIDLCLVDVVLEKGKINSFQPSNGPMRHDVLLMLDEDSTKCIDNAREVMLSNFNEGTFHTVDAHVTHGIYNTLEEAEAQLTNINKLLPFTVQITGVTLG